MISPFEKFSSFNLFFYIRRKPQNKSNMKKHVILSLCCLLSLCQLWAQQREYVIVVHGGAGAMASLEKDPVKSAAYYAALDSALMIGDAVLSAGGDGPEAVMAVVNFFENNPKFNAGKGATCTNAGTFELDASIMEGKDLSAGAVAGVKTVKNPICAAYAVKTKTPHVMLAGEGADRFAKEQGLELVENSYFATPGTLKWVEKLKQESKKNGTVGCVVLDKKGNLTAGTSTGGMFKKQWGRVGDSPVIGAGTYADNEGCAVSCTGHGEYFIRHCVAYNLSARVKWLQQPIEEAANYIIHQELNTEAGNGGLIAVDKKGNIAMPFNSGGMFRGYLYKEKGSGKVTKAVGIGKEMKTLQ
ncbi:L-asparaginase [gut metagenome]|uniref:L-asparaginase n=1 Tax=gut metagenome TaxID=749906 RepID=J9CPW0_9ZZZZ